MTYKINPQERVKQQLDLALNSKRKRLRISRYKKIAAAASVICIIGIGTFFIQKNTTKHNDLAAMEYRDSIQKEEIAAVLQHLGRIESRSSNIIPGYNAGNADGFDSTVINTEFEL